jgi:glucan phosphoethanolaminetransferase (alkaline phosphatase superfamily)
MIVLAIILIFIIILILIIAMNTKTTKMIRSIYLYLAALISLIFVAVGTGRIINTALKAYIFPEAEKGGYGMCVSQPPLYELDSIKSVEKTRDAELTTQDQKDQLNSFLQDYKSWKENNYGETCLIRERQRNYVDSFTMLLVALPICLIHWKIIKKDKDEKEVA